MFGASATVVSVTALKSGSACLVGSCHLLVKHHSNTHFILCFYTTEMPCCAHLWSEVSKHSSSASTKCFSTDFQKGAPHQ